MARAVDLRVRSIVAERDHLQVRVVVAVVRHDAGEILRRTAMGDSAHRGPRRAHIVTDLRHAALARTAAVIALVVDCGPLIVHVVGDPRGGVPANPNPELLELAAVEGDGVLARDRRCRDVCAVGRELVTDDRHVVGGRARGRCLEASIAARPGTRRLLARDTSRPEHAAVHRRWPRWHGCPATCWPRVREGASPTSSQTCNEMRDGVPVQRACAYWHPRCSEARGICIAGTQHEVKDMNASIS